MAECKRVNKMLEKCKFRPLSEHIFYKHNSNVHLSTTCKRRAAFPVQPEVPYATLMAAVRPADIGTLVSHFTTRLTGSLITFNTDETLNM